MKTLVAATLIGALAGAAITIAVLDRPSAPASTDAPLRNLDSVPKMTQAAAQKHRDDRYDGIYSIEQILALPSDFAETEALYVLAGRSDSGAVQNLIHEANRIVDDQDRTGALSILFSRLTELDPQSALALARSPSFAAEKSMEASVWRSWARNELDEAIAAALAQPSIGQRNVAAQAMYSAFGYMGNETTDRIERELGIRPDSTSRARFVYAMADRSPAETIQYIEGLASRTAKRESISWLAYHLSRSNPESAPGYAQLIEDDELRMQFSSVVGSSTAAVDPRTILDQLTQPGGLRSDQRRQVYSAMRALLEQDPESALQYFDQLEMSQERRWVANLIAEELSRSDPDQALEWARHADRPEYLSGVLGQIALNDPQRAIDEARFIEDVQQRNAAIAAVAASMAKNDPVLAAQLVDQLPDSSEKNNAMGTVAVRWAQKDLDAAMHWLTANEQDVQREILGRMGGRLMYTDIATAKKILPRLEGESARMWRDQLVQFMVDQFSVAEARQFVEQFRDTEDYDSMRVSMIQGLARRDFDTARQLAEQLPPGKNRDTAYLQLIGQQARRDPVEAARWLDQITAQAQRQAAVTQVAAAWYTQQADSALQWVRNLPSGQRDDAITGMARMWHDATPAQNLLIESMSDPVKKQQARIAQIHAIAARDPLRAQNMLDGMNLPQVEQQRLQFAIERSRDR
ncbi:MAG: hypothetical protein KJO31_14065 [Gammaproteobacteria bacterium]|nr:hypothetical protein [Gammaproteobacteria bacterium]